MRYFFAIIGAVNLFVAGVKCGCHLCGQDDFFLLTLVMGVSFTILSLLED